MIINRIKAAEFGKLSNYESPELFRDINVFYGRNETGKSTIFNVILTLLYGFSPASRENNPYVSWSSDEASCEGEFRLDDGKDIRVTRVLRSKVDGKIADDSRLQIINNNPLEFTGSISREIFQEVFALTQDKLGIPDEKLYQKLQEQLLGGQYGSFLRPVSLVCSEIDSEASSLWKEDNRGKPRDKELSLKIRELNSKLVKAREDERRIHDSLDELEEVEKEIEGLKKKRYGYVVYLDRIERIAPAARKLRTIDAMKAEAGNIDEFREIPDKPLDTVKEIEGKIDNLNIKLLDLQKQYDDLQRILEEYIPLYSKVCGIRERISSTVKTQGLIISCMENIKNLQRECDNAVSKLYSDCDRYLAGGFNEEITTKIKSIDNVELKESIDYFKAVDKRINEQEMKNSSLNVKIISSKKPAAILFGAIAAIISGFVVLFVSMLPEARLTGGAFAALGFLTMMYYFITGTDRASEAELKEGEKSYKKQFGQRVEALKKVKEALRDIPFSETSLKNPDEILLISVRDIKDTVLGIDRIESQLKKEHEEFEAMADKISSIFNELGLEGSGEVMTDLDKLEILLDEALGKKRQYDSAILDIQRVQEDIANLKNESNVLKEKSTGLVELLDKIEGTELYEKTENLEKRRKMIIKAQALEEEMEGSTGELDLIKAEIAAALDRGDTWLYSDNDVLRVRLEKEEIDRQLEGKLETAGSLRSKIEQMKDQNKLDDIIGEIECCEAEKREIEFKRDRLMVLKNIIREADRRFKDEHQPDILHRAGRYLNIITSGKYDKIYSSEDTSPVLMIRNSSDGNIIPAEPPLSRGTLEQIYFCLRIALLDHLDGFSEKLPLFMDETFINWDNTRMGQGIELMKEIAHSRQIIIFTCHKWFADILEHKTGCRKIEMM